MENWILRSKTMCCVWGWWPTVYTEPLKSTGLWHLRRSPLTGLLHQTSPGLNLSSAKSWAIKGRRLLTWEGKCSLSVQILTGNLSRAFGGAVGGEGEKKWHKCIETYIIFKTHQCKRGDIYLGTPQLLRMLPQHNPACLSGLDLSGPHNTTFLRDNYINHITQPLNMDAL